MDTSTRRGSVALGRVRPGEPPGVLGERTLEVSATHSETVLPAVDDLLRELGAGPGDVEAVVLGSGPGSFTGVRIAAALARGFRFHTDVPLYSYSSLAAIAVDSAGRVDARRTTSRDDPPDSVDVLALVDARRGQVYAAGYVVPLRSGAPVVSEFEPRALALEDLLAEVTAARWRFAGPLPPALQKALRGLGVSAAAVDADAHPTGSALLALLAGDPARGRIDDPASWEPEYLRASSAERRVGATS